MRRLTASEVRDYIHKADPKPLILDVREPWEYAVCCIEGAELIPMRQIPAAVDKLDPTRETVVVCHHGIRSYSVCRFLEQAGFSQVVNLEGGVAAWAREVDSTMPTY